MLVATKRAELMRKLIVLCATTGWLFAACGDGTDDVAPTTTTVATTMPMPPTTSTTVEPITTSTRVATTPTTPGGGGATTPAAQRCASIAFTPDSEDVASDITASGLSCAEAESFVRVAGEQTSSGGPAEVDVAGYHCVLTQREQDPLPQASYRCVNGPRTVMFVRT